jgi:TRAP-type C4-dicarboxylate transport system permease small subunit
MIEFFRKKYWQIVIVFLTIFSPNSLFAKLVTCEGPDCTYENFIQMIKNVLLFLVQIGIAFSALVFVYAGWLYLSSAGDTAKVTKAHEMFTKMITGLLFALGAYLIVELIIKSLGGNVV